MTLKYDAIRVDPKGQTGFFRKLSKREILQNSDSSGYATNKKPISITSRDSANPSPSSSSGKNLSYEFESGDTFSRECFDSFCSEETEELSDDNAPRMVNAVHNILDRLQKNVLKRISSSSSDEITSDEELEDLRRIIKRQEKELNSIKHSLARAENLQKGSSTTKDPQPERSQCINVDLPVPTPPVIKNAKTLHLNLVRTSELAECLTNSYRTQLTDIASNEQLKQELKHCQSMILKLKSQIKLANYNLENSQNLAENLHNVLSKEECNRNLLMQIRDISNIRTEVYDLVFLAMESEMAFLKTGGENGEENLTLRKSKRQRFQREFVKDANELRLKIINYFTKSTEKQPSLPLISSLNDCNTLRNVYLKHLDEEILKTSNIIKVPNPIIQQPPKPVKTNTDIEIAIMLEELMTTKERLSQFEKAPQQQNVSKLTAENLEKFQENELKTKLKNSNEREALLKSQIVELKSQLLRLQTTSSEQQKFSSKFIMDLKRQNSLLKKSKS